MSDNSRYRKYTKSTRIVRKRRIKVWGVDEDTGTYIRCYRCGFIINVDSNLGNPDYTGIILQDFPIPADGGGSSAPHMEGFNAAAYTMSTMDSLSSIGTALAIGAHNTDFYTPRISIAAQGCPLCGLTNL